MSNNTDDSKDVPSVTGEDAERQPFLRVHELMPSHEEGMRQMYTHQVQLFESLLKQLNQMTEEEQVQVRLRYTLARHCLEILDAGREISYGYLKRAE